MLEVKDFSLLHSLQTSCGAHTTFHLVCNRPSFSGIKWVWPEADHSPSPDAEVKHVWSCTCTSASIMSWPLIMHRKTYLYRTHSKCNAMLRLGLWSCMVVRKHGWREGQQDCAYLLRSFTVRSCVRGSVHDAGISCICLLGLQFYLIGCLCLVSVECLGTADIFFYRLESLEQILAVPLFLRLVFLPTLLFPNT